MTNRPNNRAIRCLFLTKSWRLGVIVLMLQIGLETRLGELVKVGGRAASVGIIGIAIPFSLGAFVVGPWLMPGLSEHAYLFLGATLAATSVGITGRVFRDLGQLDSGPSMLFAQVLATGLFMAWLAHLAGLAPIIGAFAAGLLFEPLLAVVVAHRPRMTALQASTP